MLATRQFFIKFVEEVNQLASTIKQNNSIENALFCMKRSFFIMLLTLPFLGIFFLEINRYYLVISCLYIWTLQVIRLYSIGLDWYEILLAFTPFGIKYWFKMWKKDPASIEVEDNSFHA